MHRVAEELHARETDAEVTSPVAASLRASDPDVVVVMDGAHIRAVPWYQTRHLDVTVGKVEVPGSPSRRFTLAPLGTERPLSHAFGQLWPRRGGGRVCPSQS